MKLEERLAAFLVRKKEEYQEALRLEMGSPALEVEDQQHAEFMRIPATSYSEMKKAKRPPTDKRLAMVAQTYPDVYEAIGAQNIKRRTDRANKRLATLIRLMDQLSDEDIEKLKALADIIKTDEDREGDTTRPFVLATE
jgi:hypothetical protein